jgi:uncharacterized coiled-coil protein SlyX
MNEPTLYDVILAIITLPSLILSFLSYRDRRTKEQSAGLVNVAESVDLRMRDLEKRSAECDTHYRVLEERIANHIQALDRIDTKLDKIIQNMNDEE